MQHSNTAPNTTHTAPNILQFSNSTHMSRINQKLGDDVPMIPYGWGDKTESNTYFHPELYEQKPTLQRKLTAEALERDLQRISSKAIDVVLIKPSGDAKPTAVCSDDVCGLSVRRRLGISGERNRGWDMGDRQDPSRDA